MLIINLFAGFEVRSHTDRPIALRSRKAQALLAYLSAHPGQPQPGDKLSALLWPDVDDSQARQSLRQVLHSLRRAIDPIDRKALRIGAGVVTLDARAIRVDVATLDSLIARKTPEAFEEAATLYRGDLLEGLAVAAEPFEEWLVTERERLRHLAHGALARLLATQSAAASPDAAIRTALRMLRVDPLQVSESLCTIDEVQLSAGHSERAQEIATQALAHAEERSERVYETRILVLLESLAARCEPGIQPASQRYRRAPARADCARSRPTRTWAWARCTRAPDSTSPRARRSPPPPTSIARWR